MKTIKFLLCSFILILLSDSYYLLEIKQDKNYKRISPIPYLHSFLEIKTSVQETNNKKSNKTKKEETEFLTELSEDLNSESEEEDNLDNFDEKNKKKSLNFSEKKFNSLPKKSILEKEDNSDDLEISSDGKEKELVDDNEDDIDDTPAKFKKEALEYNNSDKESDEDSEDEFHKLNQTFESTSYADESKENNGKMQMLKKSNKIEEETMKKRLKEIQKNKIRERKERILKKNPKYDFKKEKLEKNQKFEENTPENEDNFNNEFVINNESQENNDLKSNDFGNDNQLEEENEDIDDSENKLMQTFLQLDKKKDDDVLNL